MAAPQVSTVTVPPPNVQPSALAAAPALPVCALRYGPGLVVYWFGYVDDLNNDPQVLLLDDFPRPEDITHCSCTTAAAAPAPTRTPQQATAATTRPLPSPFPT